MRTTLLVVIVSFGLLAPRAYGVDININVQEMSHIPIENTGALHDFWGGDGSGKNK